MSKHKADKVAPVSAGEEQKPMTLYEINESIRGAANDYFNKINNDAETRAIYNLMLNHEQQNASQAAEEHLYELRKLLGEPDTISYRVATASLQSAGKSTAVNAILGYPLLPVATQATTACATEICYGETPSIQVLYYKNDQGAEFIDGPNFDFKNAKINKGMWRDLKEFARVCITNQIIFPETLRYFYKETINPDSFNPEYIDMSREDACHVVVMLLLILSLYVCQNQDDDKQTEKHKEILSLRGKIMKKLGIDLVKDFALRVRWDHPVLKKGLVIVDLPGLGSDVNSKINTDGTIKRSHTQISREYLSIVDAVFLFFTPTVQTKETREALKDFLESESMKSIASKESRIIPIINCANGNENSIPSAEERIRQVLSFDGLTPDVIYPISAIECEYLFVKNGFDIQRTKKYADEHEKIYETVTLLNGSEPSQEAVNRAVEAILQRDYQKEYSYTDLKNETHSINLAGWIAKVTDEYLDKLRLSKSLKILNDGLYENIQVVNRLTARIALLNIMLKEESGRKVADHLSQSIYTRMAESITKVSADLENKLNNLNYELSIALSDQDKIDNLINNYKQGFETINKSLNDIIKAAAVKFEDNVFGDVILNYDDAWTDKGGQKAESNRQRLNELIENMKNYPAAQQFEGSKTILREILDDVQNKYEVILDKSSKIYDSIHGQISAVLDAGYNNSARYLQEEIQVSRSDFDNFYKDLFGQLKNSVLNEIDAFTEYSKLEINTDPSINLMLNEIINSIDGLSLDIQNNFIKQEDSYIKSLLYATEILGHESFDVNRLKKQADLPFFAPKTIDNMVSDIINKITENITNKTMETFSNFTEYVNNLNRTGLSSVTEHVKSFITQEFHRADDEIRHEINKLSGGLNTVKNNTAELQKKIALSQLENFEWSSDDAKLAKNNFEKIMNIRL